MEDAHTKCPNDKKLKIRVANMKKNAQQYHTLVMKQSETCWEFSNILMKGLESGGAILDDLDSGDYSLVEESLQHWFELATNLKLSFLVTDVPLNIMLDDNEIFYYDSWNPWIIWSSIMLLGYLLISWIRPRIREQMGSTFRSWIVSLFHLFSTNSRHEDNNSDTGVIKILCFVIICGLVPFVLFHYLSQISFTPSHRQCWYVDATTTLKSLSNDRDQFESMLIDQIPVIKELQIYAALHVDENFQANMTELVENLHIAIRSPSQELAELYSVSEDIPLALKQAYKRIEAKAIKARRRQQANDLLVALNETLQTYIEMHEHLVTLMHAQRRILPILREETQLMRKVVLQNRLLEISPTIESHSKVHIELDDKLLNVTLRVEGILRIVGNDQPYSMKQVISDLQEEIKGKKFSSMISDVAKVFGATSTSVMLGSIAVKSGIAIVSITSAAAIVPVVTAAGALGALSLVAKFAVDSFQKFHDATQYEAELEHVEILRENINILLTQYRKALEKQQKSSKICKEKLALIAVRVSNVSKIVSVHIHIRRRDRIVLELMQITEEYTKMIGTYTLFEENILKKREKITEL
ncbi:hypothetical protein I4U23_005026 [Adineta vaga]|nr:hypothetical protein I4U23_005026 [Adineta vaga]